MYVVFSDLDGTLLDHRTYSFEAARPALERLVRLGAPLILCTSKTRAETEVWRARLNNRHPFIVENGGAAFLPKGCFSFPVPGAAPRGGYEALEFGRPYAELRAALREALQETGVAAAGFGDMSPEAVAARCELPLEEARLAAEREYDEPFEISDASGADELVRAIERRGYRCTRGGRFFHVTGGNDKAGAVQALAALYRRARQEVITVGLGDGLNDAEFLAAVDVPILLPSGAAEELQRRVPRGRLMDLPGPRGWNQAILEMIPE